MIAQLQASNFNVVISTGQKMNDLNHIAETSASTCPGANVNFGKALSGNGLFNAAILLHELTHASQIQSGILPGLPSSEAAGYANQNSFLNNNGLGGPGN